jgi:copper homeostasis protein
MPPITLELLCSSPADCLAATAGGADRIELCVARTLGGLSPSPALTAAAVRATPLPVMALIRPRQSGFAYSDAEYALMLEEAAALLAAGAAGLVVGMLTATRQIDLPRLRQFVALAAGRPLTFHRAFDCVAEPARALEELVDAGVSRVLTSGGASVAMDGIRQLAALVAQADGRIAIQAGGGITAANVVAVVQGSGCREVHGSFTRWALDASMDGPAPALGVATAGAEERYPVTDEAQVRTVRGLLDDLAGAGERGEGN